MVFVTRILTALAHLYTKISWLKIQIFLLLAYAGT